MGKLSHTWKNIGPQRGAYPICLHGGVRLINKTGTHIHWPTAAPKGMSWANIHILVKNKFTLMTTVDLSDFQVIFPYSFIHSFIIHSFNQSIVHSFIWKKKWVLFYFYLRIPPIPALITPDYTYSSTGGYSIVCWLIWVKCCNDLFFNKRNTRTFSSCAYLHVSCWPLIKI